MANTSAKKASSSNRTGRSVSRASVKSQPKKKTGSTKKKGSASGKKHSAGISRDLWLLLFIALAALLFLSLFGLIGSVGGFLAKLQFGFFGSMAYLFPLLLLLLVAFCLSNMEKYPLNTLLRVFAAFITFTFLCGITELIGSGGTVFPYLSDYFDFGKGTRLHGGFFGGMWCQLSLPAVGKIGSYVVLLVLFVAGLVLTLGKALLTALGIKGGQMAHAIREENARHRAAGEDRRRLAEMRAQERLMKKSREREERARLEEEERRMLMAELDAKLAGEKKTAAQTGKRPESQPLTFSEVRRKKQEDEQLSFDLTDISAAKDKPRGEELNALIAEMDSLSGAALQKEKRTLKELDSLEKEKPAPRIRRGKGIETGDALMHKGEKIEEVAVEELPELPAVPAEDNIKEERWQDPRMKNDLDWENGPLTAEQTAPAPAAPASPAPAAAPVNITPRDPAKKEYKLPPTSLLKRGSHGGAAKESDLKHTALLLESTLRNFGVEVTVTDISCGPSVTRYELKPEQGVKVARISALADDIKLALAATEIRIEAPIPGKSAVGIEVPNRENQTVALRTLIESDEFNRVNSKIAFAVGQDIGGQMVVADLARMPHLLIAGATGSGKSVCINSLILSILYRAKPDEVQLIMIDPKVVELGDYNGIPHLRIPVVTDARQAAEALNGAVKEMTGRYKKFADLNVRDIKSYNAKIRENPEEYAEYEVLPQIVVIVDEFADLMMVASSDVEQSVCRLAQLARAAGIHLVLATQRPSVNVITGLIKANIQSRIALAVSSGVDSRTIIDMNGAEKLLGKGDMLFHPTGYPKPVRVQGCWVSDKEIEDVTNFWKKQNVVSEEEMAVQNKAWMSNPVERERPEKDERDDLFIEAADYIIDNEKASIGNLQRVFRIGFNRAARLMDQLAEAGIVGKDDGTKARQIQMDKAALEAWKQENGYE